jgi:hypothetical protein
VAVLVDHGGIAHHHAGIGTEDRGCILLGSHGDGSQAQTGRGGNGWKQARHSDFWTS